MLRVEGIKESGVQRVRASMWLGFAICLQVPVPGPAQTPERLTEADIAAFAAGLDERGVPPGHKLIEGDIIVPDDQTVAGTYATNLWPHGLVPYVFDDAVDILDRSDMRFAMDKWEEVANVRFVYWTDQMHVVLIRNSTENNSAVGMSAAGIQIINIHNWDAIYICAHELAHTLGFWHEQSRRDRDNYINVRLDRIQNDYEHNYDVEFFSDAYGPYDFDSVMHYGQCGFSTCGSNCTEDPVNCCWNNLDTCRTMEVLPPCDTCWQNRIGQRDHLSYLDRITMSFLYPEPDWVFVDRTINALGDGTFEVPYSSFAVGAGYADTGGTIWIQPGEYWAADTYRRAVTLRAPLGGVLLSNVTGPGPAIPATCCP